MPLNLVVQINLRWVCWRSCYLCHIVLKQISPFELAQTHIHKSLVGKGFKFRLSIVGACFSLCVCNHFFICIFAPLKQAIVTCQMDRSSFFLSFFLQLVYFLLGLTSCEHLINSMTFINYKPYAFIVYSHMELPDFLDFITIDFFSNVRKKNKFTIKENKGF